MTDRDDLDTAAFAELLANTLLQEPGLREPTTRQSMLLGLGLDRRVLSGLPFEAPLTVSAGLLAWELERATHRDEEERESVLGFLRSPEETEGVPRP